MFIWILTVLRNRSQSIRHRLCAMVICMPEKNSWRKLVFQVTYCQLETEMIRRFTKDYSFEELDQWFQGLIHEYVKWANYLYEHELLP